MAGINEMPHSDIVTIDDSTLPSGQNEVSDIKEYGFSERTASGRVACPCSTG
jgi:hypothetical protein